MPSILPKGKTQFFDANGNPLAGGQVYTYAVGTTTPKTTWSDIQGTVANANPLTLDSAGEALIWGTGQYRMQVYDALGNLIWDQNTSDPGIPAPTTATEGQYIKVNATGDGYENVTVAQVQTDLGLPNPSTATEGDYLNVNATGTAFQTRTPAQVLVDIGAAAINGSASEAFNVANASTITEAVPLGQAQADFAAINGNLSETFAAKVIYALDGLFANVVAITTSETFTVPAGITTIKVVVVGGGGGGGSCQATSTAENFAGAGGAGGGAAIGFYNVSPGEQFAVTVGAGGIGATEGGVSSFGNLISATGGGGGQYANSTSSAGGVPGQGSGGFINITGSAGGDGQSGSYLISCQGGGSFLGGGGRGGAHGGIAAIGFGGGGGGAYDTSFTGTVYYGGNGAQGVVIVSY